MIIDLLQRGDLEQVGALTPEGWGDLSSHFEYNLRSSFCTPLKATIGEQLAGVGNVIYNKDTAWLSQIVVHPERRNMGVGKAITAALLDSIDPLRFETILLDATDMGYPVYEGLGFETISYHVHLTGVLRDGPAQRPVSIIPYDDHYRDEVLRLDQEASGEGREATLLQYINEAVLYLNAGKVDGVYFPTLGRGPVIAKDVRAGLLLMQFRMQAWEQAMVPIENAQAIGLLEQQGFKEVRKSRRMRLGKVRNWNPGLIFNVTGGALG